MILRLNTGLGLYTGTRLAKAIKDERAKIVTAEEKKNTNTEESILSKPNKRRTQRPTETIRTTQRQGRSPSQSVSPGSLLEMPSSSMVKKVTWCTSQPT
jgi:transcription initiation factor TFIID subunit TAF12